MLNNMNNVIYGYKCFKKGLVSSYNNLFIEGKIYHVNNPLYGKRGYHMCLRLEDTLRYFDSFTEDIEIAHVKGFGDVSESFDDYNEYYNLYAVENLEIIHILSREEIINYALLLLDLRVIRFLQLFKLNSEELSVFEDKYRDNVYVMSVINYYQKAKIKKMIKS